MMGVNADEFSKGETTLIRKGGDPEIVEEAMLLTMPRADLIKLVKRLRRKIWQLKRKLNHLAIAGK